MNLLRVQDSLRNISDDQLTGMLQNPDSTAPSYLVLSEIRRRRDMRAQQGGENGASQSTVAEDLTAPEQTYGDEQGIRALRVPGYEEEEGSSGQEEPVGFRRGGAVYMADGGEIPLPPAWPEGGPPPPDGGVGIRALAAPPRNSVSVPEGLERAGTLRELYQQNAALFPDRSEASRARLEAGRTDPEARRNEALNMALIEAGLRIAGSNNPRFGAALAEGALPAVQGFTQQRAQIRADQRQEMRDEAEAEKQDLTRQYMIGQITAAEYRSRVAEAGATNRAIMQMRAQEAQAGRAAGAQAAAMQRAEALEGRREATLRAQTERADLAGIPAQIGQARNVLKDLRAELRELGPAPSPETGGTFGFGARPNPALNTYNQQRAALQRQIDYYQQEAERLMGIASAGRTRANPGPSAPAAPAAAAPAERPPIASFMR